MVPAIDALSHQQLFSGLSGKDRSVLLQSAKVREVPSESTLFCHGDPVHFFYIVCSGTVRLFRNLASGQEVTLDVLRAGDPICEQDILEKSATQRASAQAIESTTVAEFPVHWLKKAACQYPMFALNLLSEVAEHLSVAKLETEQQAKMSATQRVGCFLERMCILYDFNPHGFQLPYSKTIIASRLGMEPETLSRAFAKLKDYGIHVDGNHVAFKDMGSTDRQICNYCSVSDECLARKALSEKAGFC